MGVSEDVLDDLVNLISCNYLIFFSSLVKSIFFLKCLQNGININDLKNNPEKVAAKVHHLESFFNGLPQIMHMEKFPFLHELRIIGQDLKQISGLETCVGLHELWISECELKKITGLENCKNLKKLFLYSNKIAAIEGLENLNLQVLWLNGNCIAKIQGFGHMTSLVELNLAKNRITSIGESLKNLKNLKILNLASNLIDSFQVIITNG